MLLQRWSISYRDKVLAGAVSGKNLIFVSKLMFTIKISKLFQSNNQELLQSYAASPSPALPASLLEASIE